MSDFTNRTFEELAVDATASVSRTLTATDVEALAIAAGDVEGFHIEGGSADDRLSAQGAAAVAMIAGLLNRRLPGPGSAIVGTQFRYAGTCYVGDTLTATVTALSKHPEGHRVEFACRCVNQTGEVLADGVAMVAAPTQRIAYANVSTPEMILRRNDGFVKLFKRCAALPPVTCAVVHPCDADSMLGALEAARRGMIVPVLIGPEAKMRAVAGAEGVDLSPYQIVGVEHSHAAAEKAVELARTGSVEALMKGSLHTD
jgi:phosphate acetyltransferase